jgi:hypothetical protein
MADFAALIARSRRKVHNTFAFACEYVDGTLAAPVELRVRWHYKQAPIGDIENTGYAMIIDLIEKAIFDKDELLAKGVTVAAGGRLTVKAPGFETVLVIDTQEDQPGPVNEVWRVGKLHAGLAP